METILAAVCWAYTFGFCAPRTLHWEPSPEAIRYRIYRSRDLTECEKAEPLPGPAVGMSFKTTWRDHAGLKQGCYEISAVDQKDQESSRSERVVVK